MPESRPDAAPTDATRPEVAGPRLRITLLRSPIGNTERNKATVRGLGLRRIRQTVVRPDNPAVRGMIFKIQHLVHVEPATDDD